MKNLQPSNNLGLLSLKNKWMYVKAMGPVKTAGTVTMGINQKPSNCYLEIEIDSSQLKVSRRDVKQFWKE